MREIVPEYYNNFTCIADKCKHSCCIGWEIDIDEDTLSLYNSLDDKMGEEIRKNIEGETPHFVLKEGDRCSFLNKKGLCDIILKYGEDALCDICALHPRFNNCYQTFMETGLGLCCEEAARIIITGKEKFKISLPDKITAKEKAFLKKREEIFSILQNRNEKITVRFQKLANKFDIKNEYNPEEVKNLYLSLERLNGEWTDKLKKITDYDTSIFEKYSTEFEQISVYFIFRHLCAAFENEDYKSVAGFLLISIYLLGMVCKNCDTVQEVIEIARMYSCEVEYCEENIKMLADYIKNR